MAKNNEFKRRLIYTDKDALNFCLMRLPGVLVAANQLAEAWQTLDLGPMDKETLIHLNSRKIEPFRLQFYTKNISGQPAAMAKLLEKEVGKIWGQFENSLRLFKDVMSNLTYSLIYTVNISVDLVEFDESGKAIFPDNIDFVIRESYQFYLESQEELEVYERCETILENLVDLKNFMNDNGYDLDSPLCPIIGVNGFISEERHNEFYLNGAVLPHFRGFRDARLKALAD